VIVHFKKSIRVHPLLIISVRYVQYSFSLFFLFLIRIVYIKTSTKSFHYIRITGSSVTFHNIDILERSFGIEKLELYYRIITTVPRK